MGTSVGPEAGAGDAAGSVADGTTTTLDDGAEDAAGAAIVVVVVACAAVVSADDPQAVRDPAAARPIPSATVTPARVFLHAPRTPDVVIESSPCPATGPVAPFGQRPKLYSNLAGELRETLNKPTERF